jgi:hypothetical protein
MRATLSRTYRPTGKRTDKRGRDYAPAGGMARVDVAGPHAAALRSKIRGYGAGTK